MLIGYSRISTSDQSLNSQIDKLKEYGCDKIYTDTVSGSKVDRTGLNEMLSYLKKGDTVVVYRLDRLGRGLRDLINLINKFKNAGVNLKSLSESIDTTTSSGLLIFHIFGAVAEFERNIIRERTMAGIESARIRGKTGGRPKRLNEKKIELLKKMYFEEKIKIKIIINVLKISRATFYNYLKKL